MHMEIYKTPTEYETQISACQNNIWSKAQSKRAFGVGGLIVERSATGRILSSSSTSTRRGMIRKTLT